MMVGLIAILKAGGAYVPLDPAYPSGRLAYMLADSEPVAVLTRGQVRSALAAALASGAARSEREAERFSSMPIIDLVEDASLWADGPDSDPESKVFGLRPHHLAYVIYTSGSTGEPKGVMVEHGNVVNLLWSFAQRLAVKETDVWAGITPMSFDMSVLELWLWSVERDSSWWREK
jgi:non-ribosomal peptide synthetase component F